MNPDSHDSPTALDASSPSHHALEVYRQLVQKVDSFVHLVTERQGPSQITCRRGCEACCHVHLELNELEAHVLRSALESLPFDQLKLLAQGWNERASMRRESGPGQLRCALLLEDGSCAAYEARPLVCRTQGMALRYPPRTFPQQAVMARDAQGSDIVWCPLNYREQPPKGEDVLEAGRIDEMLALANRSFVREDRERMVARYPIERLLLEVMNVRNRQNADRA